MVDYNGLENRCAERHRGFESLSLRKAGVTQVAPVCGLREVDENPGSSSRSAYYFLSHTIVVTFMVNM